MNPGQKHYIKLFGLRILKIKAINVNSYDIYLFFIPFLTIRTYGRKTNINLFFIQKIYDHYKKIFVMHYNKMKKQKIIKKFKNGKKLNFCIQVSRPGTWSYDYLYKILKDDPRFEVYVFINPDPFYGLETQVKYINSLIQFLNNKKIQYILGYNHDLKKYLDLRKEINPDIIFYSDFNPIHFHNQFYIENFQDKITMLCEYGFSNMRPEETIHFPLKNSVDIFFRPSFIHKIIAEKYMQNKGKNIIPVGSPKLDVRFDTRHIIKDEWKSQKIKKKRIIWAPHHGDFKDKNIYRNDAFWEIYDFMFEVAKKYEDNIQFAFRPHPILKSKIIKRWGNEKVENYYQKWHELENTQVSEGDFIDLFATSDAMIMDCCSFLAEYTVFNKPLFYTRTKTSRLLLNEFGEKVFQNVYDTKDDLMTDIENFIQDVVINGNDYKKEERTKFVQEYFGKINGKTASENIYDEIIKFLERGDL